MCRGFSAQVLGSHAKTQRRKEKNLCDLAALRENSCSMGRGFSVQVPGSHAKSQRRKEKSFATWRLCVKIFAQSADTGRRVSIAGRRGWVALRAEMERTGDPIANARAELLGSLCPNPYFLLLNPVTTRPIRRSRYPVLLIHCRPTFAVAL
jgi:hypothetical protein